MKAQPLRTVLAIYGSDEAETSASFDGLKEISGERVYQCGPSTDGLPGNEAWTRYGKLRLEDERLFALRTAPANVQAVVQQFQRIGSAAVFVLSDSPHPPGAESVARIEPHSPDENFAVECAHKRGPRGTAKRTILTQLTRNEEILESSRSVLAEAVRLEHVLPTAAEWLLDNGYVIRTQLAEIRRHLPKRYYQILPASESGDPYIRELACSLAANTNYAIDENSITEALRRYQELSPLTIAELWSFPVILRVELLEALTAMAARISATQELREAAYFWSNRLAAGARRSPEAFALMLDAMAAEEIAREPYFLTAVAEQLQDEEDALAPTQRWMEERLGQGLTETVRAQHFEESHESVATANVFSSLRALSRIDFTELFESVSLMERVLRGDPAGIYGHSDFQTRDRCRRAVERISRQSGLDELEVARRAVAMAGEDPDGRTGQVAYYLIDAGVIELERECGARPTLRMRFSRSVRRHATPLYVSGIAALTLLFTALALAFAWDAGVHQTALVIELGVLSLFPLSELAVQIINALVISLLPPEALPAMDFRDRIGDENETLVVVPMMLSNLDVVHRELEKLEVRFLANHEANLSFALLSDFNDAPERTMPSDETVLNAARDGIAALNARYPNGRFLLFHREREWSESEQKWIGRERKRGKIEELNAFLCGDGPPGILREGSLARPVRFVITLDSDTQLPPTAARRMIETISHPLNRVVIDPETGIRQQGYGIIQPRVSITLPGATATRFTRIFADTNGTDPYCQAVSDAQQDLFSEGIFHGKAIYDLHAFHRILGNRFPRETLLSHDLIEGSYVGVGLASGIEVFENLPLDYASYSARQHRWARGDWQIARWVLPWVTTAARGKERNPLSFISRWRIFDNLRRSLVPVASMLLLFFGWVISSAPGVWTLVVGLAVAIPAVTPLLDRVARVLQGAVYGWRGAADELKRAAVSLVFLPHQAWLAVDAIARVLYRTRISHRDLLEWQTAESAGATTHQHTELAMRHMRIICGCSLVMMVVLALRHASVGNAILLMMWAASPLVMRWLNHSESTRKRQAPSLLTAAYLRRITRKTWRFFDDFVGPATKWLPPDNYQVTLRVEVATRTSPTNIGLWLASALAAHDSGYLTCDELLMRCSNTMATLEGLERYEGHLLNWYDTNSLMPLLPRYVSTVDSGNLTASLWVLEQGCRELLRDPVLTRSCLRGLSDTIGVLVETCGQDASTAPLLRALRRLLRGKADGHELVARLRLAVSPMHQLREAARWPVTEAEERAYWLSRLCGELERWIALVERYLRWMETLAQPPDPFLRGLGDEAVKLRRSALRVAPSLEELMRGVPAEVAGLLAKRNTPGLRPEIAAWLDQVDREIGAAREAAAETVVGFEALIAKARAIASGINMGFLYDRRRRLFGIGYAVGGPREFTSHYDLLASECRLASLVAIAKGDVPLEHWSALARPHLYAPGKDALLSWSGTMFEYLMPLLFTRSFANSLLEWACRQALARQVEYGNENSVPWGISECAYSALDAHQIYQYRAFGVPVLALKQEKEDDLVVAPYATALALLVDTGAATDNLRRLERAGLCGPMGFFESVDYSRRSSPDAEPGVVIGTYMAHHQGMTMIALDNILHGRIMQRRFHSDLRVRAIESLLFERIPIARLPIAEKQQTFPPIRTSRIEDPAQRVWEETSPLPRVHLQGNGRYALMVTNSGAGYSRWKDFDITRWRADTTRDAWGSFVYIRDLRSNVVWATAQHPIGSALGSAVARFSADKAEFFRSYGGVETVLEVTVSPEEDVELRRLTITNKSQRARYLEFTSYLELALAPHGADKAHPAFSKMFVQTECVAPGVLIAHRRPRSDDDRPIWAAHMLVGSG